MLEGYQILGAYNILGGQKILGGSQKTTLGGSQKTIWEPPKSLAGKNA